MEEWGTTSGWDWGVRFWEMGEEWEGRDFTIELIEIGDLRRYIDVFVGAEASALGLVGSGGCMSVVVG